MEAFKKNKLKLLPKRALLFCLISLPALANAWSFDGGGSLKGFFLFEKLRQTGIYPHEEVPIHEQRLRLQGALTFKALRLEFANETFFYLQRSNPPRFVLPDFNPKSAWGLHWSISKTPTTEVFNRLDRAFIQMDFEAIKMVVGKQVIPLGVGHIFNAVSQMQRYPLIFIDPEFPKTEDAVTFIWTGPLQFEGRYLPKNPGQEKDNFHLRAKGSWQGADWALTSGRSDDKEFVGLEAALNVGDSLLRAELVSYFAKNKNFEQGLIGFDTIFSSAWSSKWEVFYNGFGEVFHRSAPFRGTWYGANLTSWEIHPLLKAHLLSIVNLKDPSALFHLYFNYSLSNSWDLLVGQFLSRGKGTTEFGGEIPLGPGISLGQPDITYAALRWYF